MLFEQLHPVWQELLGDQRALLEQLDARLNSETDVVPAREKILAAFARNPEQTKVLLVGQDPYPNPAHAVGLAFAVPTNSQPLPPTLANIYRELAADIDNVHKPNLASWSERGVMLLNRHLTTRAHQTAAHVGWGWGTFTAAAVSQLNRLRGGKLVAVLWGKNAQQLAPLLAESVVISSPHPSPLSSYRGFFGSRPFSKVNAELLGMDLEPVDWS